jgi:hypothetical protein
MQPAKISLSPEESALVRDQGMILTKRSIMHKAAHLLGNVSERYKLALNSGPGFIPEWKEAQPKISRGENYKELPYLILDYPARFGKEDVFALRTFFWWGHYFSLILHLKGKYQHKYLPSLLAAMDQGWGSEGYLYGVGDEWDHTVEGGLYKRVSSMTIQERRAYLQKPFFKWTGVVDLDQWDNAEVILDGYVSEIIQILGK